MSELMYTPADIVLWVKMPGNWRSNWRDLLTTEERTALEISPRSDLDFVREEREFRESWLEREEREMMEEKVR